MTMAQPTFPHHLKGHCVLNPRGTLITDRGLLSLGHRGRGNFWAVPKYVNRWQQAHRRPTIKRKQRGNSSSGQWDFFYECLFSPAVSYLRHVFLLLACECPRHSKPMCFHFLLNLIFPPTRSSIQESVSHPNPPNQLHINFCFCQVYLNQLLVQIRNGSLERNAIYIYIYPLPIRVKL